jgi:hypothetical protein
MTQPAEQPMPVANDHADIQSLVIADVRTRREVGIQRYGTPLQPFNGRDALRDAYEEALDLAMYLRQVIAERDAAAVVAGRGAAGSGGAAPSLADALKASLTDAKASRGATGGMGPCDDLAACGNPRCQYCHPAGRGAADGQTT